MALTVRRTFYFISDLHIGGDEALGVCDFEKELIVFIEMLAAKNDEEVELLIVGDAFGLWEFTEVEGEEKIAALVTQFPEIFEAFRSAGEKIRITLLPGNHDYELACYPSFIEQLGLYNICLEQSVAVTRQLGKHRLWIEHGSQHDPTNRMPDFGNPHAQPIGYYITRHTVGSAGRFSERGRYNWLKDVQSVYPTEDLPNWILSNYFYREMSPFLRWILVPFLISFTATLVVMIGSALDALQITGTNIFLNNRLFESLGFIGSLFQLVLTINVALLTQILILAIPGWFIVRDLRRTAQRFGIELNPSELTGEKEAAYLDAARVVFGSDPTVSVFIYGHTHAPSLTHIGEKMVLNTGTWLKRLKAVRSRFRLLPSVYVPSFCLNYFRICEVDGELRVDYEKIEKAPEKELSLFQRMMVPRSQQQNEQVIPACTKLPGPE